MATIDVALTFTQYKTIDENGNVVATDNATFYATENSNAVEAGTNCTVTLNSGSYMTVCFYDSNGNILEGNIETNTPDWSDQAGFSVSFTPPSGASYIRVMAANNSQVTGTLTKESADTPTVPADGFTFTQYKTIDDSGNVVNSTNATYYTTVNKNSVTPNSSYRITLNSGSYMVVCFYDSSDTYLNAIETNTPDWSYQSGFSTTFTVPSNASYIRVLAINNSQVTGTLTEEGTTTYTSEFADILYNATIWNVIGDSISEGYNVTEAQTWHSLISSDSQFSHITKYNTSLSSSAITDGGRVDSFIERYTQLNADADLVTIFGGVNDYLHNMALGNKDDTVTTTFYGAINTLIPGIKSRCPNARIIWMSPMKTTAVGAWRNELGFHLLDYIQAIQYKCREFNIEYIDLYEVGELDPEYYPDNYADQLHPTPTGHSVLKNYLLNVATVSVPPQYKNTNLVFTKGKGINGNGEVVDVGSTYFTTLSLYDVTPNTQYFINVSKASYCFIAYYDADNNHVDNYENELANYGLVDNVLIKSVVPANAFKIRVAVSSEDINEVTGFLTNNGSSGGDTPTPPVSAIVLNTINNMAVDKGQAFNILYSTNIPAVKHEFSWDGGNNFWDKTNEISVSNSVNYKYTHEAKTDVNSYNMAIRVTDAQGNTSTKSFTITFMDVIEPTGNNTQVLIYNKGELLTPVNTTPTTGQYKVDIVSTSNCTAQVESDFKTITLLTATGNSGEINLSINIEGKKVVPKTIPVASITSSKVISSHYSEQQQLANKFSWLVSSGTSSSNMELTADAYNVISKNINLTADRINLNGYVSNDDANWSIDNEGNIRAENLNVEGNLSADSITCNTLNSPKYPGTLDGDIELFVNSSSGNDDAEPDDGAVYKTVQGAIDALPKFLNGKNAHITMQTNSTEDVYLKGFVGGTVRVYMNGKTLYGTFRTYVCSAAIYVYGGTKDSNEGATGIIHPNVGLAFATRSTSVGFESSQYGALYKVKVFAPDTNPSGISSTEKVCVASQAGTGSVYCKNVQIVNAVVGFRCNNHGSMHVNSSSGIASKYGFQCVTGGMMSLANNSQAGGSTSATNTSSGGQMWYDSSKVTFASGNQTTESGSAPVVSGTKTMTIKSSYGDTYRSSVYNNWKKDGTARQGDYGYGDCTGCWFFGTAFAELKGKTINKVTITITRQSGGSYAAVGLAVKAHNYSARPSGAPTLGTSCGTLSLATGSTGTLTITNSTVLDGISAGTVKGFGIRSTYDAEHYAVCSGSVTVKITYTE